MSPINFLDARHDLMFVKGIVFRNVDSEKHWKLARRGDTDGIHILWEMGCMYGIRTAKILPIFL